MLVAFLIEGKVEKEMGWDKIEQIEKGGTRGKKKMKT